MLPSREMAEIAVKALDGKKGKEIKQPLTATNLSHNERSTISTRKVSICRAKGKLLKQLCYSVDFQTITIWIQKDLLSTFFTPT